MNERKLKDGNLFLIINNTPNVYHRRRMIYDIGYKTLSRFWSVKRMPYVIIHTGWNHRQTKELLIALGQTQAARDYMQFRCHAKHVFSSLWARKSEVNNVRWKCSHHYNSDPRPVDCKRSRSNFFTVFGSNCRGGINWGNLLFTY